ncbi:RNA polymerase sigma factor [Sphingobacterium multivorum]|uniref:RNA polymerase sigma factor n=1 Tax=Sphingobacterium TaxID=28453 RepID=UPI00257AB712|nr:MULTISPECIES: RNA polymerase sigma-70 factor [unclassified Sphingobacterium]
MITNTNDLNTLSLLADGDEAIFSQVYESYWEDLFKYVMRILNDLDETADIVQESFISFWEIKAQVPRIRSLKAYLFILARNKAFKRLKEKLKNQHLVEQMSSFYAEHGATSPESMELKELSDWIDTEINKLPERMREVFILSRKQYLSYQEIAQLLNISDQTVKKQIYNSLKFLRQHIDPAYLPYLTVFLAFDYFTSFYKN